MPFEMPFEMPGASKGVTDWRGEMRYTSLGKVGGLPVCLEALHLLGAVAGHSLERGPVLHDAQIAVLDEDLDGLASMRRPHDHLLTSDLDGALGRDPAGHHELLGAQIDILGHAGALEAL